MTVETEALTPLLGGRRPDEVRALHGDGSARRFLRVLVGQESYVLLVGPDAAENAAYVRVARHLAARGVRVPAVLGVDEGRGWILLEDLGDRNLWGAAAQCRSEDDVRALYDPVLDLLVRMQVDGAAGFGLSVGFAPAPYDGALRVEWEGLYFARELAAGYLGLPLPAGLQADVERLSEEAGAAPGGYFLHRDFQSRNIQLLDGKPALIDFQGARPGPLAYDAAALILDPYVRFGAALREELFGAYCERLEVAGSVDVEEVRRSWFSLGAFRLLQALGAFGKLGGRLGKSGFLEHAPTALDTLERHLGVRGQVEFPSLWGLVRRCRAVWPEPSPR